MPRRCGRASGRSAVAVEPPKHMFDSLSDRLQGVFRSLRGEGRLTEQTVEAALREIRMALLEADVNFKVVKAFIDRVRDQAVDQDGPQEPDACAAGRADRARRDAGALRRQRRGASTVARAPARDPAARPAGLGQDDDVGEAGAVALEAGEAPDSGVDRRPAARGHRAAVGRGEAGGRPRPRSRRATWTRCAARLARWPKRATAASTWSSSTPRAGCTSTTS